LLKGERAGQNKASEAIPWKRANLYSLSLDQGDPHAEEESNQEAFCESKFAGGEKK
jgi:hypothetical protein